MTHYTGTLYLEAADCECEAVYELDVIWCQGKPYVSSVGFVHNEGGRESRLRSLSIEEYRAQKAAATGGAV